MSWLLRSVRIILGSLCLRRTVKPDAAAVKRLQNTLNRTSSGQLGLVQLIQAFSSRWDIVKEMMTCVL